ncbi:unnamed protein product [Moneuplotes crassus]|uniref:Lipoprotein n=1 Tax=Euplotes crassus TaxID=5936 RepID=A0AAD1U5C9_EUPCR|nr:unnamed protein product [Moneuplotes crassus]
MNLRVWFILVAYLVWVCYCDPSNYPVVFDFSGIYLQCYSWRINKELIEITVTEKAQWDLESGYLAHTNNKRITFSGQIEQQATPTYEYSINAWVYSYSRHFDYSKFILSRFSAILSSNKRGMEHFVNCWSSCCHLLLQVKSNSKNKTYNFGCSLDSDNTQKWARKIVRIQTLFAWQFYSIQYKAQSSSSFAPSVGELNITVWDQDGSVVTESIISADIYSYTPDYYSIGHISQSSTISYRLKGEIAKLSFYNEFNDGGVQHRNVTNDKFKNNYIAMFDFQNSSQYIYQDNIMKVIGVDSSEQNTSYSISEINGNTNLIVPTSLGWIFGSSTVLKTSLLPFKQSIQFMVEVEGFCLEAGCQYGFEMQDNSGTKVSNSYQISDTWSAISPSYNASSIYLIPQNFTVLYFGGFAFNSTKFENSIKSRYLRQSSDTTANSYESILHNGAVNLPTADDINLVMNFEKMMISKIKFYRHVKSGPDVWSDLELYKESDDAKFNFMQEYSAYPAPTANQPDVCEQYITPANVCLKQDANSNIECQPGFIQTNNFCYDKCGDGIVQTPQTVACDDGNENNGDGCNSNCKVETGYVCTINSQNKSECIRSCGDAIKQSLEQCDDGNDEDGDGCNSRCFIESGYKCDFTNPKTYCFKSCGDQELDTGEQCDDGNLYDGDGCNKSCQIEGSFNCDNTQMPSKCTPLCGNGVKDAGESCDDKNSMKFDGCSETCQIEDSYECNYNVTLGRDLCISTFFPPIIKNSKNNILSSEIQFTFNDTMGEFNFTGKEVSLSFTGPAFEYKCFAELSYISETTLKLKYSISPSIIGGSNEELLVTFKEVKTFYSQNDIPISNEYEFRYTFDVLPSSDTAKGASSTASFTLIISFILSVAISVFTGESMEQMWSLANTLQILFFLGLLEINYPSNLRATFEFMKYSNFDNPLTKMLSEWISNALNFGSVRIDTKFADFGFESSELLFNSFDKILMILLIIFSMFLFYWLAKIAERKNKWYWKLISKTDKSLRYESSCRFIIEVSMVLSICIFINLFYGRYEGTIDIISYGLSMIMLGLLCAVLIYCYFFPLCNFEKIQTYPDKVERHCILFLEFKRSDPKKLLFYYIFTTRRILLAAIIVGIKQKVLCQLVCILILFYWNLKYMVVHKPFKSASNNFLNIFNESFLFCFAIALVQMTSSNDSDMALIGYLSVGLIIIFFMTNMSIIIVLKCRGMCKCKGKKKISKLTHKNKKPTKPSDIDKSASNRNVNSLKKPETQFIGNMDVELYIKKFKKEVSVYKVPSTKNI